MLSNGDRAAGPCVVSPRIYRRFALSYEQRIAALSHTLGVPYAVHVCGNTNAILADLVTTGADALDLDYKTDVRLAHDLMKASTVFIANLDPSSAVAARHVGARRSQIAGTHRPVRRHPPLHPERRLRHPRRRARGQHPRRGARSPVVVSGQPRSAWRPQCIAESAPSSASSRPHGVATDCLPKGSRVDPVENGDSKGHCRAVRAFNNHQFFGMAIR
jgi:hypothetical protein